MLVSLSIIVVNCGFVVWDLPRCKPGKPCEEYTGCPSNFEMQLCNSWQEEYCRVDAVPKPGVEIQSLIYGILNRITSGQSFLSH